MIEHLGDDVEFMVVCMDRDLGETERYPDIKVGRWQRVGKGNVIYMPIKFMRPWFLRNVLGAEAIDAVYFNSFFNPFFTIFPLWAARYGLLPEWKTMIAPRGEFSEGAMKFSSFKKMTYVRAVKASGILRNVQWHASSQYEADDIKRVLGVESVNIRIAPDLPGGIPGTTSPRTAKAPDLLRIVSLSRVVRQKNLAKAIEIVAGLSGQIIFDIYGLLEDKDYVEECERLIRSAPGNVRISLKGPISHEAAMNFLNDYDVFLLPTNSENFGHAIYEAMSCGLPVVISDRTPWRDLQAHSAGYDLDLNDSAAFRMALTRYAQMSAAEFECHRRSARKFAENWLRSSGALELNRKLFAHGGAAANYMPETAV